MTKCDFKHPRTISLLWGNRRQDGAFCSWPLGFPLSQAQNGLYPRKNQRADLFSLGGSSPPLLRARLRHRTTQKKNPGLLDLPQATALVEERERLREPGAARIAWVSTARNRNPRPRFLNQPPVFKMGQRKKRAAPLWMVRFLGLVDKGKPQGAPKPSLGGSPMLRHTHVRSRYMPHSKTKLTAGPGDLGAQKLKVECPSTIQLAVSPFPVSNMPYLSSEFLGLCSGSRFQPPGFVCSLCWPQKNRVFALA